MLKVVHVLWSARIGGREKLVLDLAMAQSKSSDIQVSLLICQEVGSFLDKFKESGLKCSFIRLKRGLDLAPWKYLKALELFRSSEIIHLHSFNPILAFMAVLSKKNIFFSFHGELRSREKNKWRDYFKMFLLNKFLNSRVNYISFNSEFTKQISEQRFNLRNARKSVIYNGINFNEYFLNAKRIDKQISDSNRGRFVIGTATRFIPSKRIEILVNAFSEFQKYGDAILLIVGDGPLRSELIKLINKLGISNKVILTGYKHNIKSILSLMDVCVFPFENEGFGLVALEALALGKPSIVFKDGGGITEIIRRSDENDIIENKDQLIIRLKYYFDNKDVVKRYMNERIDLAKKFDIRITSQNYIRAYKDLLSENL